MNQFIPTPFLPLPTPRQWPTHQVSLKDSRPIRPFSTSQTQASVTRDGENPTRFRSSYQCMCGANPLNDPHNLAVAALHYTPLTHHHPSGDHRLLPSTHSPRSIVFARKLYDLLPSALRAQLTSPHHIDNLRHIRSTDPGSQLRPLLEKYFPDNLAPDRTATNAKRGYRLHQNDQYDPEEWDGWNEIHRTDLILRNPAPFIKSRRDNSRDLPPSERPSGPTAALRTYHPALPSTHHFMAESATDRKALTMIPAYDAAPLCWCGTRTPRVSHSVHVYFAFVGRTMTRALEMPVEPWQEPLIGQDYIQRYGIPRHMLSEASYALWQIMNSDLDA